jgi:predicted dehydrogenase
MRKESQNRREFLGRSAAGMAGLAVSGLGAAPRVLGANERISIGVIGCGGRGSYLVGQARKVAKELNLDFTAVCDVWRPNRESMSARFKEWTGKEPFSTSRYADLLARDDVDAVFIATPDHAHTPILIAAVGIGKDAYCEKPMAVRLEDAIIAVDAVRETKRVVQIGTQRRSEGIHIAGAKLVRSGVLGTISEVKTGWHDSNPRWARSSEDVKQEDVDWKQYLMYLPDRAFDPRRYRCWHLYKDYTVGTPGLLGSHTIDIGTWFMDDPLPKTAVAHGGIYVWKDGREHADTIECLYEYPKGFMLTYSTRLGNSKMDAEAVFYGTGGTFYTEPLWTVSPEGGREKERVKEAIKVKPEGGIDHVRNWIECLRSRKDPNAPIEVGYAHSVASIMAFRAWESGRRQLYVPTTGEIREG